METHTTSPVYQGQFGEFTITPADRQEVILYRAGLVIMALCVAVGAGAVLVWGTEPLILQRLTLLYGVFCVAMGLSLLKIHIYLSVLHRVLQICWGIGCAASLLWGVYSDQALAQTVYGQPLALLSVGFTFVALNGIFFKEAFCFNRIEAKLLTLVVPSLLLGHLIGILPAGWESGLLLGWAILFLIFGGRKLLQPIPPDIGDKSVFTYLHELRQSPKPNQPAA